MKFEETLLDRTIQIGEANYKPLRLGNFIRLEFYKSQLYNAIKYKDKDIFVDAMRNIVKLQTGKEEKDHKNIVEMFVEFLNTISKNTILSKVVFIIPPPEKKEDKPARWDYDGRIFAQWIDLIAKTYGWDIDKILDLDLNMAVYLIQEILVNQQLDKEFIYSLSELAYPYDAQTKKSTFQPLHRPYWMKEEIDAEMTKPVRMMKKFIPHGVISISGVETPNTIKEE